MKNTHAGKTLESMGQAIWYNIWTMQKFSPYLKGEILEVGCGIGNFTNFLTNYGKLWAIDVEENYIRQTKKLVGGKAEVGFGDIESGKYFFDQKEFDCIVCLNVLEHIKNDEQALKNMFKLLKPNGKLILLVPAHRGLYGVIDEYIRHYRRYEKNELLDTLKKIGFKIFKARKLNLLGAIGWFIAGKLLKDRKVDDKKIKIFNLISPPLLFLENFLEPPVGISILLVVQK